MTTLRIWSSAREFARVGCTEHVPVCQKMAFNAASESDDDFFCHYCSSKCMRDEIKAKQRILSLKASLGQHSTNDSQASTLCVIQTNMDTTSHSKPQVLHSSPPRHSSLINITTDRKYNTVIFGVSQSPQATPRFTRSQHDYTETSSILSKLYEEHLLAQFT